MGELARDIQKKELRILEKRPFSEKAAFSSLNKLSQGCHGIVSLEHMFLGAYADVPQSKLIDVWEIPPFGQLGDSEYNGLTAERVNCVFISNELANGTGFATNFRIRYENYIQPYAQQLEADGASVYDIQEYGRAYIMNQKKTETNI